MSFFNQILPFPLEPDLWVQITVVVVWLVSVLLLAESLNRFVWVDSEVTRKIVHIGTGNVILFAWWLQIPTWVGIGAAITAGIVALISYQVPLFPGINSVGRKSFGTFFYAVSIGILVAWFWPLNQQQYAVLGILVMTYGDGFAAVIGQKFGRHCYQLWGNKKSWEGSLTMLLVSYVISSSIFLVVQGNVWQTWTVSAVIAVSATALESFSKLGLDNLTVPIGSAALAFFLNQYLLGNWPVF